SHAPDRRRRHDTLIAWPAPIPWIRTLAISGQPPRVAASAERLRPSWSDGPDVWPLPEGRADVRRSALKTAGGATQRYWHDGRITALQAPACRDKARDACSEDYPASRWSRH